MYALVISFLLTTSAFAQDLSKDQQDFVTTAETEISKAQKVFMSELQGAMKSGAPEAMQHCHLKAPHLNPQGDDRAVQYGRTSHKLRSKANKPSAWMQPHLDTYKNLRADSGKVNGFFVNISEREWGYLKPIYVKSQCLVCHGETLSKDVKTKLQNRYPGDMATDFKLDDFRGFFWAHKTLANKK